MNNSIIRICEAAEAMGPVSRATESQLRAFALLVVDLVHEDREEELRSLQGLAEAEGVTE